LMPKEILISKPKILSSIDKIKSENYQIISNKSSKIIMIKSID